MENISTCRGKGIANASLFRATQWQEEECSYKSQSKHLTLPLHKEEREYFQGGLYNGLTKRLSGHERTTTLQNMVKDRVEAKI